MSDPGEALEIVIRGIKSTPVFESKRSKMHV
jgi:hypothetical protein